tara:strand:- start:126 stop:326 length:201 start_codon:yes stop_codon:yes gene_type:complete
MTTKDLMTLEDMQEALKDKKLYVVAKATGLTYPTLKKIADGKVSNHTYSTLLKVSDYLTPPVKKVV